MKTVIMAGGKGTRIASMYSDIPKPMIPILDKPILEYQINCLREQGCTDLILVIGHLGAAIKDYFGDGQKFGVSIRYIVEEEPLGTAGALYYLKQEMTEDFLLLNGDIIFDINIERFFQYHKQCGGIATLFTHPNSHPYDSGIVIADENGCVESWLHKEDEREWYRNRVNAGIHMLSPTIFGAETGLFQELKKMDLDRDVLKPLIPMGKLYVYDSPEYVKDMGTPARLCSVAEDIQRGKVKARNLTRKQKAIFLDRDGTINEYVGFLTKPEELELIPGAAQAIKRLRRTDYLIVVVTNQPVVARGEVTEEELREIHNKMETLLGMEGAYVNAIYHCPHHPHKGYDGEVVELKIECDCRKPKAGMLLQAAKDFNIDLENSWMVGDRECDVLAGKTAGCRTALISEKGEDFGQDVTVSSLLDFSYNGPEQCMKLEERLYKHVDSLVRRYPQLLGARPEIIDAYLELEACYLRGGKLLIAGNGGSATDSEHIAGELMKRFKMPRPISPEFAEKMKKVDLARGTRLAENLERSLMAISLVASEALLTAYLNDTNEDGLFAQQLMGYGKKGDVFLAISTSGNSQNIMNATVVAKASGIRVVGLTGADGGELAGVADVAVKVPETETYLIQELHLPIYHCWCMMLEDKFFGETTPDA